MPAAARLPSSSALRDLGTWQQREVQLALDRQAEAERTGRRFPVIPVLLPKVEDPPGGFLKLQTWVDLRADLADPVQLKRLLTGIRGVAPAAASTLREAFCPYRGLLPFREEDAGLFFGRQEAIDTLLAKLRAHDLITLVGRSGSGKSSVVYAGVLPALRRRADGRTWSILSLRPGPEPLHALVRLFDPPPPDLPPFEADDRVEQQVEILRRTDSALSRRIRSLLATADEQGTDRLLLHIDQWEELYTQALHRSALTPAQAEADVTRFIDLLLEATNTSPCTVVLTVRADFYGELLQHDRLAAAVPPGQVNLGLMRREDLAAAIQEPATAVDLTVDPPLLAELLDEVCNDLGKLPLLEYALKETWRGREGTRLTLNAYGQAGGIDGAVAKRANDIYTHLRPAEQAAARRLFVSLVTPGEGREDTRARAVYPAQDDAIGAVVHAFSAAEARLLVTGEDTPSAQRLVEISHETLIREWDVLKAWINDNREALRRREHIRARMRQWKEQDRDQTLLLPPGLPLEEGRKLLADHGDVLIEEVQPYITASIAADEERLRQEEVDAEAERQRELAAAQRLISEQRKRTRLALGFSLVTLLLAIAAVWQWRQANAQRKESDKQRQFALARQLAAQAERVSHQRANLLPISVLLAIEALQRLSSLETDQALRNGLTLLPHPLHDLRHESAVRAASFSPDGRFVVSGSEDKTIRVGESATGKEVARMTHAGVVSAVSFSPDGRLVVSGSGDDTARVGESTTGKEVARMTHADAVTAVSFSPDGRLVVSGSEDKTARMHRWRPEDLIAEACSRLTRNLTKGEWRVYLGNEPYQKTCKHLPEEK